MSALPAPAHSSSDPRWRVLLKALVARYGPDTGAQRYLAQRNGSDPDLIAWRRLGERA